MAGINPLNRMSEGVRSNLLLSPGEDPGRKSSTAARGSAEAEFSFPVSIWELLVPGASKPLLFTLPVPEMTEEAGRGRPDS